MTTADAPTASAGATRTETDSMGPIEVPADHYWAAQTQRSLHFFAVGRDTMPRPIVRAFGLLKRAAADVNRDLGLLPAERHELIARAADEVADDRGPLAAEFPLRVWQTGLGHAVEHERQRGHRRARQRARHRHTWRQEAGPPQRRREHEPVVERHVPDGAPHGGGDRDLGAADPVGPRPARRAGRARRARGRRSSRSAGPTSRTRCRSRSARSSPGYVAQLDGDVARLEAVLPGLREIALGGTAVGTGLNAHPGVRGAGRARIAELTGQPFTTAPNKFQALAGQEATVFASGALKTLATSLMKIANDIRWLGSGPRAGLGELRLPENEPGSSIMPGKVNPTQSEMLTMVCIQVFGYDAADRVRRQPGQLRAQRLQAGDRARPAARDRAPDRRLPLLPRALRRRPRARPRRGSPSTSQRR